jgi:hypothetical protein
VLSEERLELAIGAGWLMQAQLPFIERRRDGRAARGARTHCEPTRHPADEAGQTPSQVVGSPEAILEQRCYWRERAAFSYYTVEPDDLERLAPIIEKAIAVDSR